MRKSYAMLAMVFWLILLSCQTQGDDSRVVSQAGKARSFKGDASDSCFDIQLEVWLGKFIYYQQDGASMFEADAKAREAALQAYLNCQSKTDVLANDAARK